MLRTKTRMARQIHDNPIVRTRARAATTAGILIVLALRCAEQQFRLDAAESYEAYLRLNP